MKTLARVQKCVIWLRGRHLCIIIGHLQIYQLVRTRGTVYSTDVCSVSALRHLMCENRVIESENKINATNNYNI